MYISGTVYREYNKNYTQFLEVNEVGNWIVTNKTRVSNTIQVCYNVEYNSELERDIYLVKYYRRSSTKEVYTDTNIVKIALCDTIEQVGNDMAHTCKKLLQDEKNEYIAQNPTTALEQYTKAIGDDSTITTKVGNYILLSSNIIEDEGKQYYKIKLHLQDDNYRNASIEYQYTGNTLQEAKAEIIEQFTRKNYLKKQVKNIKNLQEVINTFFTKIERRECIV